LESSPWNQVFSGVEVKTDRKEKIIERLQGHKLTVDRLKTFDHDLLKSIGFDDVRDRMSILEAKDKKYKSEVSEKKEKVTETKPSEPMIDILVEFDDKNKVINSTVRKVDILTAIEKSFQIDIRDFEVQILHHK
jgi:hypothetical protein